MARAVVLALAALAPISAQEAVLTNPAVAEEAAEYAGKACLRSGGNLAVCGVAGGAVLWFVVDDLASAVHDARQSYGYFVNDDLRTMNMWWKTMNNDMQNYSALLLHGSHQDLIALRTYNHLALSDGSMLMQSINKSIADEENTRAPHNPVYNAWCWADWFSGGCPYVPTEVDTELKDIQRRMGRVIPLVNQMAFLAKHDGPLETMVDLNRQLQSAMEGLRTVTQKLRKSLASDTPSFLSARSPASRAHVDTSFAASSSDSNKSDELSRRSSILLEQLQHQQSANKMSMSAAMMIGVSVPAAFLSKFFWSPGQHGHHVASDDMDYQDMDPKIALEGSVGVHLVALTVAVAACCGIYAWSWSADLQLDNQVEAAKQLSGLPGSIQASLDAAALCGQTCQPEVIAQVLKHLSDSGELALEIMISSAEKSLQASKLFG